MISKSGKHSCRKRYSYRENVMEQVKWVRKIILDWIRTTKLWDGSFENEKRNYVNQSRYGSKTIFQRKKMNAETYKREWLCYLSPEGKVFCFVCKLFSNARNIFTIDGFDDWNNINVLQCMKTQLNIAMLWLRFMFGILKVVLIQTSS